MKRFSAIVVWSIKLTLFLPSSTSVIVVDDCKQIEEKPPAKRLKDYLFCDYEHPGLWANDETNGTQVDITFVPKIANFDEDAGNLDIFGWTLIGWKDPHLKWNATSFENTHWMRVSSHEIWNPEITVFSAGNENANLYGLPSSYCYLISSGRIYCAPQVRHTVRCQTDFTQWPFDRQNCTLVFSTWSRTTDQIRFSDRHNGAVIMSYFLSNGEWTLTASRAFYDQRKSIMANRPGVTSPRLSIDFIVDRVHNQLSGRYVSPTIIMMAMTLTTLWLDPRSIERFAVACVNPMIHLFCIQSLHDILPHNGSAVPSILVFYADSLVLATIALLLTIILANVQGAKSDPPKWMSSSTAAILRSRVGLFFLPIMLDPKVVAEVEPDRDDSGDLLSSESPKTTWRYFAILCSLISFVSILFTYLIMYVVLVPNSSMRPTIKGLSSIVVVSSDK